MKTKLQKSKQIEEGLESLAKSQTLIFTDFTSTPTKEINSLREVFKEKGLKFKVFKKRLFKIAFEKNEIEFPLEGFQGQLGIVFTPEGFFEQAASLVYKFSKTNQNFKIIGGFDLKDKKFLEGDFVKMVGSLPNKQTLLAQFAFMLTVPIKRFLFVLDQLSKQTVDK
jgi:large subunit ribosomal protein L10